MTSLLFFSSFFPSKEKKPNKTNKKRYWNQENFGCSNEPNSIFSIPM